METLRVNTDDSDARLPITRGGCAIALLSSVVLWGGIVWLVVTVVSW